MTKFVWSGAQDTNWFNPNNWNPAIVPGQGVQVVIPAGLTNYPVIADEGSVSLNQGLTIGAGGTLTLNSGQDGVHFDDTDLIFNGGTTFALSGGGAIVMSDSPTNRIYSNQGGTTLSNDDTIEGAGQIYSNGALAIINNASGVINGNAVHNELNVNSIHITNNGLVESTNVGGLGLSGVTLDQSSGAGVLSAAGGNVYLNNTTILGGTLEDSGGSLIETSAGGTTFNGTSSHQVDITQGSTVQVNDAQNLTIIGVIAGKGTILLDSGANGVNFDDTDLIVNGSITDKLQGGGTIQMSDSGANRIYSTNTSTILENVDDTITGAGQIYSNNSLSILNDAAGVINASAAHNQLNVNGIYLTNNGLVESTNAAGLGLYSMTLDQSTGAGILSAAGGNVDLSGTTILGGLLETSGISLIETTGGGTTFNGTGAHPVDITQGSTVQVNDAQNLTIVGVMDGKGTIMLDSGANGVNFDDTDLIVNGSATVQLEGGGVLQLSNSNANRIYSTNGGTTLENVDDTITGAGQIYSNNALTLKNDASGVINASAATNTLNINSITVNNTGLVESTSTGGLQLSSMTLNNVGGTLQANGGNVYLNAATIVGGSLKDSGGSLIETDAGGSVFNGTSGNAVTVTGGSTVQINDAQNLTVFGVINDQGTILLDSGENGINFDDTDLIVNGSADVQLEGGGVLQLSNSGANRIYSTNGGTTLENVDDTITGAGQIYSNNALTLQNDASGIINASSATNTLVVTSITVNNTGLVESTSTGGLQLSAMTLNNVGGTLKANGGNVYLSNATIQGGTLNTVGSSLILTNGGGSVFNGATNTVTIAAGATVSITDATNLTITGTINNAGVIDINSDQNGVNADNTDLLVQGGNTVTLTGGGTVQMVNGPANRIYSNQGNTVLDNINNKIQGSGQIFASGALSITNEAAGSINASNTGQTLSISSITITNKGSITSINDAALTLNSMTLSQSGAGTLAAVQGNIYFNSSHIIAGSISGAGAYAVITNGGGTLLDGSSGTLSITSGSTVRVTDGQNLSLTGTIANAGTINLDSGQDGIHFDDTDLLINGAANLTGGGTVLLSDSGANRIYSNTGGSVLTNTDDTIVGGGQIFSNGALSITNSAGGTIEAGQGETLTVSNLSLTNSGVLEGNGGSLVLQANVSVSGSGTAMVANGGAVIFSNAPGLGGLVYAGPNAGTIVIPGGVTPTVSGFAAGDTLQVNSSQLVGSLQFTENAGNTSGVLAFMNGLTTVESFTLNGFYTTQDFQLIGGAQNNGFYGAVGVGDTWNGSTDRWNTSADWSQGSPGVDDDVVINTGSPNVTAPIGTVRSLSALGTGSVNFGGVTGNTVSGMIYDASSISLDATAGQGGASLAAGSVDVVGGGTLTLGNSTLSADDQMTVGSIANSGTIALVGSASKQALLNDSGAAGFAAKGVLTGAVSLAGDSAIEFGSGGVQQIATGGSLTENGASAFVEIAGHLGANSALTSLNNVSGTLSLENKAVIAPTAAIYDSGALNVDNVSGSGGTVITLPALYVTGAFSLGNSGMTVADQVNVSTLGNQGAITLSGGASAQALLNVTSAVAFDQPAGTLYGTVTLSGTSAIKFASGALTAIASGASLHLQGAKAYVEIASGLNTDSALTTLSSVAGTLTLENGANFKDNAATLNDSGAIGLDTNSGDGGSSLTLNALNVTGSLTIGNASLSSTSKITATSLANTGSITVIGAAATQALLNVTSAAGFGTAGVLTGSVSLSGKSGIEFASGAITSIAGGSSLDISGNAAFLVLATGLGSNSALKTLSNVSGTLRLDSKVTVITTVALTNTGVIDLDIAAGEGGSLLTTSLALTNGGTLNVGNSTLSSSDLVTAQSLVNTGGINVIGGASIQAEISVASVAGFGTAGVLTGAVSLAGDSAIVFNSGTISTIATGATLTINGASAYIENSTALGRNSTLSMLSTDSGVLSVHNSVTIASSLGLKINAGAQANIDNNGGEGGSHLTFGGGLQNSAAITMGNTSLSQDDLLQATSLTNTGSISLTGGGSTQTLLNITSAASIGGTGLVTGTVSLLDDAAIEFASGTLTGVNTGANLTLNGPNAYIEDATSLNSNSALSGFSNVAGVFDLFNGGTVASTSPITDSGQINISTTGGSHLDDNLSTTGLFKITGSLSVSTNTNVGANVTITAGSLNNSGSISLSNGGGLLADGLTPATTLLNVKSGAGFGTTGAVTGSVYIGPNSAIEFASGSITQIGASSKLELAAANSYLEDSTGLGSNSALSGLTTINSVFQIDAGSVVSSTAAAGITNSKTGTINIDTGVSSGGGSLSTTGLLTNAGTINLGSGPYLSTATSISAASLNNLGGTINLSGNTAVQALISVSGAAGFGTAGFFKGNASLFGDSAIDFGSGSITNTVAGSTLRLDGFDAAIESGANNSGNSALTALATNAGVLDLENGDGISDGVALTNSGGLFVDSFSGDGSAGFTDTVSIKNTGTLNVGNTNEQGGGSSVSTASLTNTGDINLTGNGNNRFGELNATTSMTNNGAVFVISDLESISGTVGGTGTFDIWNGSNLSFGGAVGSGQTVTFDNTGTLGVNATNNEFAAAIAAFGGGDTVQVNNFAWSGANWSFQENGGNTGGVLTITNGANSTHLTFDGVYANGMSSFNVTGNNNAPNTALVTFV